MSDPWAEVQDWERWAREVLTDWRVPFDNHKVGLRLGITQHLCDIRDERDEYKAGFKEAMTDHAATLERLADCERQRDEPCGFKGDEPTCLVASRLKARLEERERELEYAYRVVHCGVVFGNFDFSILRVRAALFVESKDGQCSLGSAGGET